LDKGGLQLNGKLGISGWGVPVAIGVDYGITPEITVGGELSARFYNTTGYKFVEEDFGYGVKVRRAKPTDFTHSIFGIFANGNYHFHKLFKLPSKVDVFLNYIGISKYPYNIFTGINRLITMLFVPNLLIANPAVLIFLGKDTLNLFFYQIVFTVFLIIISRTIFRKGLKKYESAGR